MKAMITTTNSAYMIAGIRQMKDGKVREIDWKREWLRHMW